MANRMTIKDASFKWPRQRADIAGRIKSLGGWTAPDLDYLVGTIERILFNRTFLSMTPEVKKFTARALAARKEIVGLLEFLEHPLSRVFLGDPSGKEDQKVLKVLKDNETTLKHLRFILSRINPDGNPKKVPSFLGKKSPETQTLKYLTALDVWLERFNLTAKAGLNLDPKTILRICERVAFNDDGVLDESYFYRLRRSTLKQLKTAAAPRR